MPNPDTFEILGKNSIEAGWSPESEIVLLCYFLDQLHARLPGTEDDGILGDFERFLSNQREIEGEQDETYTPEPPPGLLNGVIIGTMPAPLLYIDFENNDSQDDGDDGPDKFYRWKRAVDMDETTQGLEEWEG